MAHLHRHGKALQYATSAVTDDCFHLPSNCFQSLNPVLVRSDGFVGQELPEEILFAMRTTPDHDAEELLEVCRVHDDDHLIGCQLLLLDLDSFQLPLHPFRTPSVHLCNLCMGLFAMSEFSPDFFLLRRRFLTELFTALRTFP